MPIDGGETDAYDPLDAEPTDFGDSMQPKALADSLKEVAFRGRAFKMRLARKVVPMVLGKYKYSVALAIALTAAAANAQTTGSQAATGPTSVPDAPTPHTQPNLQLNTITPAAPAVNAPPAPAADDNGGYTPGTSLPGAPSPTAQAEQDAEQGPPPAPHASDLQIAANLVIVPFTVKDSKNHLVPGLTWRDVRIYEDGLRQQMKLFTVDPYPLSVALVIDQSVTFDTMEKINDSLASLQGAFTPYDEISVFTYNNGVTKQTDFTAAQSARLGVILDRSKGKGREPNLSGGGPLEQGPIINNQAVDPNTTPSHNGTTNLLITPPKEYHTLFDAIQTAAETAATAGKGRRRLVYVISDGKEYGSKVKEKQLIKYLQTNHVGVYATLVGDSAIPGMGFLDRVHLPLTMRDNALPRLSAATGGQIDPEFRPKGIEASFARISEEVRTQYTVGYYTHESPFNEHFRKVEVRVLRPSLSVIAEDGYYPSASDSHPSAPVSAKPVAASPKP
jgi:VWFA-related protein